VINLELAPESLFTPLSPPELAAGSQSPVLVPPKSRGVRGQYYSVKLSPNPSPALERGVLLPPSLLGKGGWGG